MGYPTPLPITTKKVADHILIASGPFSRVNALNFGYRMALFRFGNDTVVWSAIPYGKETIDALKIINEDSPAQVTHLVIPDLEHTMAAKSFKAQFPKLKIIAPEGVDLGPEVPIDYKISASIANKVLKRDDLEAVGIKENTILDNFEFVYLPSHKNKELVMYDIKSKILFEADLLFNLGTPEPLEQYSPETGFPKNYYPHSGFSFLTRYMYPDSTVGRCLMNKVAGVSTEPGKSGIKAIYSLDFNQIVMCHGNIISKDAKEAFKKVFADALK
ncbi:hypothetical protein CAAN1_17S02322 [[Candida] anglica]|uniref:Metallo-beta-lactamase domain-containing protein n=1 Tax=[Candida] anglica TaxID=148631 RepID=A0ABP0E7D0_9ASCO